MPRMRLILEYTSYERKELHRQGIWVDREGEQIPVRTMGIRRLESLVRTIVRWARKDESPDFYLKTHPIVPHLLVAIGNTGLLNSDTEYLWMHL